MGEEVSGRREVLEFNGKRIRYNSPLSFDEVLAKLQARVGETNIGDLLDSSATRDEFEKKVRQSAGDSGFMLMVRIDHGHWLEKFGIKRRLVRWIFGNPLIALTMLRHDYSAGLFVPPELLLAESSDGAGCNITYVLPSSLIAIEENPQLLAAALALDAKIEALVASAVMI
jgi:uncharacterized protein (DUF302 family)